jgi:hypothetical protein
MDRINSYYRALAVLLAASSFVSGAPPSSGKTDARQIQLAVSCLVKAPYLQENLESINLATNESAEARYHVGDIPELGPTPGELQIVVYGKSGRDAWLFFADPNTAGAFTAVRNAYRLKRGKDRWTADYGNGGPAVYDAVGRFATALSQRPSMRVRLIPGGSACTTDK